MYGDRVVMNILLRLRCWRDNICYRHRMPYSSTENWAGGEKWCDYCDNERIMASEDRRAATLATLRAKEHPNLPYTIAEDASRSIDAQAAQVERWREAERP